MKMKMQDKAKLANKEKSALISPRVFCPRAYQKLPTGFCNFLFPERKTMSDILTPTFANFKLSIKNAQFLTCCWVAELALYLQVCKTTPHNGTVGQNDTQKQVAK